jgi:hypothetical protein
MRPNLFRAISAGLLGVFGYVAAVTAQQPAPAPLTAAQVRQLVAGQQAADHARLRAHFEALSARYAAEANTHTAFQRAATGIPRGGEAAAAHHKRLAEMTNDSAAVTRELATHHGQLSAGNTSTAPSGGERFERGVGAPAIPTERQMLVLAARAQRPSEHGQLSEYYSTLAARYAADAKDHRTTAAAYRGQNRVNQSAVTHFDRLVQLADASAKETQALAAEHKLLAIGR